MRVTGHHEHFRLEIARLFREMNDGHAGVLEERLHREERVRDVENIRQKAGRKAAVREHRHAFLRGSNRFPAEIFAVVAIAQRLEKRVGFKLAQKDVYLNIAGGLKVNDPAIDLSIISAILSSNMDVAIDRDICMAGEVGLSGEIRPVNRIEQRISEAEKLGFKRILIPKHNLQGLDRKKMKIEIIPVRKVEEAFRALFG